MLFRVNFDYAVDRYLKRFGCFLPGDLPATRFEPTGGGEALTGAVRLASFLSVSLGHFLGTPRY